MKGPRVSIGRIRISGVDDATAARLGPAIERALAAELGQAAVGGSRRVGDLKLTVAEGASATDIARTAASAVTKAVR